MSEKKLIGIIFAVSVLIIGAGGYFVATTGNSAAVEQSEGAVVTVETKSHEWGEIGINNGTVMVTFPIKNTGTSPLSLYNIETSCMCTTAMVKVGQNVSPKFGMHSKSDYVMEVAPGDEAELVVEFDPAFHGPSGVGPINRQITVQTNDPANPKLTFIATAMVTK